MFENKFHVGDEVVFINSEMHEESPQWYPKVGTVGFITDVWEQRDDDFDIKVQWPKESTSWMDEWLVRHTWIEPFYPDQGEIEKSDLPISFLLDAEVSV